MEVMRRSYRTFGVVLTALLALAANAAAQQPVSAPSSAPAPENEPATAQESPAVATSRPAADHQRLNDYVAIIEGPNIPLPQRRTGARELLRQGWAETPTRLAVVLNGQSVAAQTAVALALADLPQYLEDDYIEPLIALLHKDDEEVRRAAASALAGYRDHGVTPRLRELMLDESQPLELRLAAIDALGMMTQRAAAAALVEALRDPNTPICQPALRALEQATAQSFHDDVAQAQAWWEQSKELTEPEWRQAQIDRLIQRTRGLSRRLGELEGRLVESFRNEYIHAAETDRAGLLQGYLADSSAMVRLLGLDLVKRHQDEGKTLSPEVVARVRALLADPEPEARAAAVQAVARLRDAADADRFLELLAGEPHLAVRLALVNALGYVGTAAVVEPLFAILAKPDDPCMTEAVAALGRLAERGVLSEQQRTATADRLLTIFEQTEHFKVALRERVLWAMSLVADPRFGPVFATALRESEETTVRRAAVRGIATLKDAGLADALVPAVSDPDQTVRRSVVELLAELASTDAQLAALASRLDPAQESDAAIRAAAWGGIVRVLSGRPAAEIESWVARLPESDPERGEHVLTLLGLSEKSLADVPEAREELGLVRAQIATRLADSGQVDPAIAAYLAALGDLHAAQSADIPRVALELVVFTLVHNRYDESVASTLANGNPSLEGTTLWNGVKPEIEQRLTKERCDEAITMLTALQAHPPTAFPADVTESIAQMLQRARQLKSPPPTSAPASQPTSAPAQ